MIPNKVKAFERDEYAVIFNGRDMTLGLLPPQLSRIYGSDGADYAPDTYRAVDTSLLADQAQPGGDNTSLIEKEEVASKETEQDQLPALYRLTLNVSNTCNMACKYCYANAGNYYTCGILMDKDTALNAVNFLSKRFSVIEHINFFGGEPTLNQPIIELVCEYFIYLHDRGVLPYLPRFGLTTNGYAIDSSVFRMLRTYDFSVTVSLDGPKEIHDRLRTDREGSGTYDAILENTKIIIDMGIVPEFESTFTDEHHRMGIEPVSLMDFFYDNFKCHTLHCPIVTAKPGSRWFVSLEIASELYADAIRYSVNNLANEIPKSISVASRLLSSLATKTPICHYCPAGQSSLTVNADGNIYACFMLVLGEGSCLGNVNGEQHGFGDPVSIDSLLRNGDKWQNAACRDCWAQSLCFGCLGEDLVRGEPPLNRSAVPGQSSLCDFKREMIKAFLVSAAELYLQ